jgi:hypothetical protein
MRTFKQLSVTAIVSLVGLACAGQAYLPGDPGGAKSDISGADVRELWLASHPEIDPEIGEAIREAVFVPGMSLEHRDVITNARRKGSTGDGFWRSHAAGGETRYQWFVSSQREPFIDGRGRRVCELVFAADSLTEVRYCSSEAVGTDAT